MATNGGLVLLSEMMPHLTPSEQKIGHYILEHPQEVISMTAQELGTKSSTSSATVIRLCKSLQVKGFQDLKIRIAGDLQKENILGYRDIQPNETILSILEKMTDNSIQTVRETAEILHVDEIEKAVHLLKEAKQIHFIGVGASSIIAQDAQQKFLRINKLAYTFTDIHMAATQVAHVSKKDVVVGISFSGETSEVAKVLALAKQKGAKTISITKYGNHKVTKQADINLYTTATREAAFRSGATSSRIAQLQVIDILFMSVVALQYEEALKSIDQTRKAIEYLTT